MKVVVRDRAVFASLPPREVATYLRATGWTQVETAERFSVWSLNHEEILLPNDQQVGDYASRIGDAVKTVTGIEGRPELDVIRDITEASSDVLRFRSIQGGRTDGIPLDAGVRLVQGVRDVLVAAACAAISPRSYYPNRKPDRALEYLRDVRMAQPERGSYVIAVVSPVPPALGQISLFSEEPFARRVMKTLAVALDALLLGVDQAVADGTGETIIASVRHGVSANLCEALQDMVQEPIGRIEVRFTWSRARPEAAGRDQFALERDMAPYLEEAGRILRESSIFDDYDLQGLVVRLDRGPSDPTGAVTVNAFVDGYVRKVLVDAVPADSYSLVVKAHDERRSISCRGELTREGGRYILRNPRFFALPDD